MEAKQSITEDFPFSITKVCAQVFSFSGTISRRIFIDNLMAILIWASYLTFVSYSGYDEVTGVHFAGISSLVLTCSQFDKIYDRSKECLKTTKGFLGVVSMTTLLLMGPPLLLGLLKNALPHLPLATITSVVVLAIAFLASHVRRVRSLGYSMMFAISPLSIVAIPYVAYALLKKDQ